MGLRSALQTLKVRDLRFPCHEEEMAFKKCCEKQILVPFIVALSFALLSLSLVWPSNYTNERSREDAPFMWELNDPRTLSFASVALSVLWCVVLLALGCLHLCTKYFVPWSWEHVVASTAVFLQTAMFFMSTWHAALMYKKRPEDVFANSSIHAESYTLLAELANVIAVCMYIPIRANILWVVPVSLVCTYICIVAFVGSCYPDPWSRAVPIVIFVCVMQLQGARRHEMHVREKWLAVRRMREQDTELQNAASLSRALSAMTGTMSDVVVMLSSALTIMNTGDCLEAYFGKPVAGSTFHSMLANDDRQRFDAIVAEATRTGVMQSMPASIELEFATLQVQLVLVGTGSRAPSFIVGLHTVGQTPLHEGMLAQTILSLAEQAHDEDGEDEDDDDGSVGGVAKSRLESIASTTVTGKVFAKVDQVRRDYQGGDLASSELKKVLFHIAEVGTREHWLLAPSDLQLLPGRVLGSGGFGVVVMATLRGTAVAAKLPKDVECTSSMSHMSSVINELRVHRHIRHTNITLFYGACIDPSSGNIGLIYELVRGSRLDMYVKSNLKEGDSIFRTKLLLDIASALQYLHTLKPAIVHGDMKTTNILVESHSSCPKAKVLDFGLSRVMTKQAKPLGGTRQWMAPELFAKTGLPRPRPEPAADVFSFGMLAFFVVTGRVPIKQVDTRATGLMRPQRGASLPLVWHGVTELREQCRELCGDCLRFDPTLRVDMGIVQSMLLLWLPADPTKLQALGPQVLCLILGGVAWEQGLRELRGGPAASCEPTASDELRSSPDASPSSGSVADSVRGNSELCTWPEQDEEKGEDSPVHRDLARAGMKYQL